MIQSSGQLKDKIRNLSKGDSWKAQTLIRNYMMERFLERCSVSPYQDKFILKGGMLVASMIGLNMRATMDIDATIRNYPLTLQKAKEMIEEIARIKLPDQVEFSLQSAREIMEEHEYPGLRFMLNAYMDKLRQPIKIDISTGDIITPAAVSYQYPLMFEKRNINIMSYNLESVLAEKLETILARDIANTRMRDFYDICQLSTTYGNQIHKKILEEAYQATAMKRNSLVDKVKGEEILKRIGANKDMRKQWELYLDKNSYIGCLPWEEVMGTVMNLYRDICG